MQGLDFSPASAWGNSALLCFDAASGRLQRRIPGPARSALGDMALTAAGDLIVSDGDNGGVYLLHAKQATWQRLDHGDFISPQNPALHSDGRHVFIADYLRGIAVLEIATGRVRWLAMQEKFALNGIDGLYFHDNRLLAVQNGAMPERVVSFTLDQALTRVVSETIIERATRTLGDPTHGVVVAGEFYYLANSGWDAIDGQGHAKADVQPAAPRIMRVELRDL